jgi:glycosyltransferase involved in cell wall biosynthesis
MAKISIITINFNDKLGLDKTIKSVLNQTFTDFEFLVIDGGSTDGSTAVIEQNTSKINYWISEKDSGVYNAQNKGIKAATGDFVIFKNSGDTFVDNQVLSNVAGDLTNEFDIYYGDNFKVKADGSKRLKTYPEKLSFSFFYGSCINHQSTFIRRNLFERFFYYSEDLKIVSDWEFFIYAICKENIPYKYLSKTIANYDFTGISSLDKYKNKVNEERLSVMQKYFPAFVNDYVQVSQLNSKRVQQVLHIQKYPIAWKILKIFISIILVFIPKIKK